MLIQLCINVLELLDFENGLETHEWFELEFHNACFIFNVFNLQKT